jgi:hypothetical protein
LINGELLETETMSQPTPKHDSIDEQMAAILATKTEAERLRIAWGMWRAARRMVERIVAAENPGLSKSEQNRIVAQRMSHGT